MPGLKAVIFDMDGVIIDSEPMHVKIETNLFEKLGVEIQKSDHESYIGMPIEDLWTKVKNDFNLTNDVEELMENHRQEIYNYMSSTDLPVLPNVKKIITEVHEQNLKLAVASSSPKEIINLVVERLELKNSFNFLISGEEVTKGKPDPEIFIEAAKQLSVSPEECLVIEDSKNGVIAAKESGMKCIGFQNINSGSQDLSKADDIIDSMEKLTLTRIKNLF